MAGSHSTSAVAALKASKELGTLFKRLSAAAMLAAILIGNSFADTVAHTSTPSHYAHPCFTGNNGYNAFFHVLRPTGLVPGNDNTWGSYVSVKSQVNVITLQPCTSATSTAKGWSMVNAVNAEVFDSPTSSYAFVQFGYAKQACVSGGCQDSFQPYVLDFWYTAYDDQNGQIYEADWVDFNNDGVHDVPKVGDRYEFTITQGTLVGNPVWTYSVKVITSNTYTNGSSDSIAKPRTSGPNAYINRATWGAETHNDASAMGVGSTGPAFDMDDMKYKTSNGSIYTTVTGATCFRARIDGGSPWNSQKCGISDYNGSSHMEIWTQAHT